MRIYPVEDSRKTVGLKFTREQAVHLATVLLVAAQDWAEIDLTAWRVYRRKSDASFNVTVTTAAK